MIHFTLDFIQKNKKEKVIIGVSAFIFLVLVVSIFSVFSGIDDLEDIIDSEQLVVITDSSSIGYVQQGDSVYGFQYEIIKVFADSLGVDLKISAQNDMRKAIKKLIKGRCDVVAGFLPITKEYQTDVRFTKPLLKSRQMLIQRIDSTQKLITKQYELANETIYIRNHSMYRMRIENLSEEIADSIYIREIKDVSIETMVKLVSQGKIKNTICSEQLARRLKREYPNIDISLPVGFMQVHGWAVNADAPELLERLNTFLSGFIGSPAYWKLYRKYYL